MISLTIVYLLSRNRILSKNTERVFLTLYIIELLLYAAILLVLRLYKIGII